MIQTSILVLEIKNVFKDYAKLAGKKKQLQTITTSGRNNPRFTSDIRIECELLQKVLSEAHSCNTCE